MSTTIDQRVVEMRFDNKHFESNVSTTMSTLDKLKAKLNFSGASKGLENINTAVKHVNMNGLGTAVESVSTKFSAMQVIGVTALANITNSAVNAGKRIASALTIDPIKSGFQEYETQINATQTILANTQNKGSTIEDVNKALAELNKYADMTIYNFTEMTRNIGTFTAAGIDLNTSVNAIQGIANLAAVSGSTSQQASTAMYQLSQALAAGTIRLMDWNSVVNAGMGGEIFQTALRETSEELQTGAEAAIKATGSFRESLREEWLTAEVLTETLKKFTTSGANEYVAKYTGLSVEAVEASIKAAEAQYGEADAIEQASKALAEKSGKNAKEIADMLTFAKNATDAATKVKTFTQLWDVLKEAAQSGWAQTWKIIVGDFEEAKNLLTPLADFLTGILNSFSDWRNAILESALGKSISATFGGLNDVLNKTRKAVDGVTAPLDKVTSTLGDLDTIVKNVIRGDFGNGVDRINALTEAGENYYRIQNKVNEALGNGFRYSEEKIAEQDKILGAQKETTKATEKQADATVKLTDADKRNLKVLTMMSEARLRDLGYSEEQIKSIRELREQAEKLGIPLNDFIDNLDEINGRWLLINSFKNIGKGLVDTFNAIKTAWQDVFPPKSIEERAEGIFNLIAAFHKFTSGIAGAIHNGEEFTETGKKLVRTFKGVFALVDIVTTILSGGLKIAFKAITSVLGYFNLDILSFTALIGDAIVKVRDWLDSLFNISGILDIIVPAIKAAADTLSKWFSAFKDSEAVQKLITAIEGVRSAFSKLFSGKIDVSKFARTLGVELGRMVKSLPAIAAQIGKDFIAGFQNGINFSISDVISKIVDFCLRFVEGFKEALGVQSPSWKAYDTATDFFQGFINGAKDALGGVIKVIKGIGEQLVKVFKGIWDYLTDESGNLEWDKIIAGGIIFSTLWILKQFATAFKGIAEAFGNFGDLMDSVDKAVQNFSKVLKAYAWDLKAKALMKLAIAVGILVAAIWVLTQIDDIGKLWNAVIVIGVLSAILVGLAIAMDKLNGVSMKYEKGKGASLEGLKSGLLQIALALAILAVTVKLIGAMPVEEAKQGFKGLAGIAAGLIVFMALLSAVSLYAKDVDDFGKTMLLMSVAMLLMVTVIKKIAGIDPSDIVFGLAVMEAFVLLMFQMGIANRIAGENGKFGSTMLGMVVSMALMTGVIKLLSGMDPADILTGLVAMEAFVLLMLQMGLVNRLAGKNGKVGSAMMGMAISMVLMIGVIKLISGLKVEEITKGLVVMEVFVLLIAKMLLISRLGKDAGKVAGTILSMAVSVGILAGLAVLLSMVDIPSLAKGIVAVGILSAMMSTMARSLKGAQDAKGAIMWMAIAIGIMAAAIVGLSFIEPGKLVAPVAAIGILMGMFALMVKASKNIEASIGSIAIMLGVVVILAGVLFALSLLNVDSTIEIAASIGILMVSLGATMTLISKTGSKAGEAIVPLIVLGIIAGLIGVLLVYLSHLNPGPTLQIAVALSAVLLAMSASALILSRIGTVAGAAIGSAVAFLAMVVVAGAILAAIGGLVANIDGAEEFLASGIPIMESIGRALGSLIGGIIGGIGEGVTNSLPTIAENIKKFVDGLVDIANSASNIEAGSFDGVSGMIQAMLGISVASLLEHFASGITGESSMDTFKVNAIKFVDAIVEVSNSLANATINDSAIEAITKCGLMFAELNKALPRTGGIAQDIAGEQDLAGFANSCRAFAATMIAINSAVSGDDFVVQSERISLLVAAGERFNELNTALPRTGGIAQDLAGEQDLAGFGEACRAFVVTMIAINSAVSNEGFVVQSAKLADIVTAGLKFNELNTALPKTGGIAQDLAGEQELAPFGAACAAFVAAMIEVNTAVSADGFSMNLTAIDTLKEAGLKFNELQNALPKTGGWWQEIAGQSDLEDFGGKIEAFGSAMTAYSDSVSTVNNDAIDKSISTAYRIKNLVQSLVDLDASGVKSFAGVGAGDGHLVNIGQAIAKYGEEVADLNIEAVSTSVSAATKLRKLIAGLVNLDASGVDNFKVDAIGDAMKTYSDSVGGINATAVTKSVSAANQLKNFISGLSGFSSDGVGSFKTAINELSTVNLNGIVKAFSGASTKLANVGSSMVDGLVKGMHSKTPAVKIVAVQTITSLVSEITSKLQLFNKAGVAIIDRLIAGIASKKHAVRPAITTCLSSAVTSIRTSYTSFYNAGSYLVSGFASGISANTYKAAAKARAMADAAEKAARDALGINSPSRVFKEIGAGIPEGFAMGINEMSGLVKKPLDTMADEAIKDVSKSLANIANVINTDIDAQPVIRPVLDLSDIQAGASTIGSLLNTNPVGVSANVNAINSMMGSRSQNGSNADVISAIDKLRDKMSNVRGDTYNINGVNYSDDAGVGDAMKVIVRAAKIGRRT